VVIDFRIQPPYRSLLDVHFFRPRPRVEDPVHGNPFALHRETPPSFHESSIELFLAEMEEAGIEHAVILGQRGAEKWGNASNDDIADLVNTYPERFTGFGGIDPNADVLAEAKRIRYDLGLTGIALVSGWGDPPVHDDAPRLMPLYGWCAERKIPVAFTSSHFIGADMLHSHPVHLQRVAMEYPDLRLIIAHGGWPWTAAACALAMRCTNVYLMPEFYMYLPDMPGARDYIDAANGFLRHRMLYSSCYPSNSLNRALTLFRSLPLSDVSQGNLLHHNAARLLEEVK